METKQDESLILEVTKTRKEISYKLLHVFYDYYISQWYNAQSTDVQRYIKNTFKQ